MLDRNTETSSLKKENKPFPVPKNEEERRLGFEQYKLIVESINKSNDVREISNSFWTTVNALSISGIAYIRDSHTVIHSHKVTVLWIMIASGITFCLSWLSYLHNIKKTIEIRNYILTELESFLPFRVFTYMFEQAERGKGKSSLTLKEMITPILFLLGYLAFSFILICYSHEAAS